MKLPSIKSMSGLLYVSLSGHALLLAIDITHSLIVGYPDTDYLEIPANIVTLATALLIIPCSIHGWLKCFNINTKNRKPSRISIKFINTVAVLFLLLFATDIIHPTRFHSEFIFVFWTILATTVYLNKKHYQ